MNNKLLFVPQWHTTGTISTPDTNYKALYPKANDSHWYFVDSDGSEKRIETSLDIRNGITTTNYATSSFFRARLDVSLGLGLTFSGNFAGSTISVFNVTTDMLSSLNTATAGYVLTSNGSSFNWVPTASVTNNINGTTDKIAKYNSTTTLGDSLITDDGVKLVVGTTPSFAVGLLNVDGSMYLAGYLYLTDSLNTYIRYNNGIEIQTNEDIVFRDELGYNYLNLKTDNISSYTFSILESTLVLGDNGSFSYLLSDDIDSVSFGVTSSTMTFSMFSDTPGVLRLKDTSEGSNKVFVSDSDGYGRWQNLRAGAGMTVSGITYSVRLGGTGLTISSNALTFDYSILGSTLTHSAGVINLNNTGVTPAVYGTQGIALQLTIDAYGRVTNVGTYTTSVNYGNGIEIIGGIVGLGGTISKSTIIDASTYSFGILKITDPINFGYNGLLLSNSRSLVGYYDGIATYSKLETIFDEVSLSTSDGISVYNFVLNQTSKAAIFTDTFNNKGLEYGGSYSGNFTTYSLVDKEYVDNKISGVTVSAGLGLTGSSSGSSFSLQINPNSAGNGLTYSGGSYSINFNSDSLEINSDIIRLSSTISSNRLFTGGVTISNNFSVTGSTVLNNLTASNTYISSTGSNALTIYSSGTGSTIFRVQGISGELFSIIDGLTGSLFSVNDISGLPILEVFSDDTILMGDYTAPSLNTTTKVTSVTGSNIIYSISKSSYTGAFFEYTVTKGTNARAGSIMSVWNGITSSYTETSTVDIGLTTDIIFLVTATGSNAILTASASSSNWIIKTIIRSI